MHHALTKTKPHAAGMRRLSFRVKIKEPVSAATHLFGAFLGAAGLLLLVTLSGIEGKPWHSFAFSVFGLSLVSAYLTSALYHGLPLKIRHEKLMRTADHTMIYVLIAGTYTPVCLIALPQPMGYWYLAGIWGAALAGGWTLTHRTKIPRSVPALIYVVMGWAGVGTIAPLLETVSMAGVLWLLGGGISYTVGAVIYVLKRPNPWPRVLGFHEVFHLLVMGGSICHFWFMLRYVLPLAV